MRTRILRLLYKMFPFELKGDCLVPPHAEGIRISCIINFYGRLDLLSGILHSLAGQTFPRDRFEVILVEDRGGTEAGRAMAKSFTEMLPIVYTSLKDNFGRIGYSRNYGLSLSRGDYVLFLDDDTVILQEDFLATLLEMFEHGTSIDAIVPFGRASYALIRDRYDFHDPFFMTNRCLAYSRSVLAECGGFVDKIIGQEDVEFATRFHIAGKNVCCTDGLSYFHPPLVVASLSKPESVGFSFFNLRGRYSFPIWCLFLLNCSRHAPLIFHPERKYREMGRFGMGFLSGVLSGLMKKRGQIYR